MEQRFTEQMRQKHQHKKYRPDKEQCGKESEVFHGVGADEHEAQEGAHSGEVARNEWLNYVLDSLFLAVSLLVMGKEMQGVIHCYSDNYGPHPYRYHRHGAFEQGEERQSEQCAESNGEHNDYQRSGIAEEVHQQGKDEYQRKDGGDDAVGFDTVGVLHRNHGGADIIHFHSATELFLHLVGNLIYLLHKLFVARSLAYGVFGGDGHYRLGALFVKDVPVDDFVAVAHGVTAPKLLKLRRYETQRVVHYYLFRHTAGGRQ